MENTGIFMRDMNSQDVLDAFPQDPANLTDQNPEYDLFSPQTESNFFANPLDHVSMGWGTISCGNTVAMKEGGNIEMDSFTTSILSSPQCELSTESTPDTVLNGACIGTNAAQEPATKTGNATRTSLAEQANPLRTSDMVMPTNMVSSMAADVHAPAVSSPVPVLGVNSSPRHRIYQFPPNAGPDGQLNFKYLQEHEMPKLTPEMIQRLVETRGADTEVPSHLEHHVYRFNVEQTGYSPGLASQASRHQISRNYQQPQVAGQPQIIPRLQEAQKHQETQQWQNSQEVDNNLKRQNIQEVSQTIHRLQNTQQFQNAQHLQYEQQVERAQKTQSSQQLQNAYQLQQPLGRQTNQSHTGMQHHQKQPQQQMHRASNDPRSQNVLFKQLGQDAQYHHPHQIQVQAQYHQHQLPQQLQAQNLRNFQYPNQLQGAQNAQYTTQFECIPDVPPDMLPLHVPQQGVGNAAGSQPQQTTRAYPPAMQRHGPQLFYTAEGYHSTRPAEPVVQGRQPWLKRTNYIDSVWNMKDIHADYYDTGTMVRPHLKPVPKSEIMLGMSSRDAVKAAMSGAFARGAGWALKMVTENMIKEIRESKTMLGFQPNKKVKAAELDKAMIEQIVSTNPPSIHAAACAEAIAWSYDEFYPGIFQLEGIDGKPRSEEEILKNWEQLRQDMVPNQLKPVIYETTTGLVVMTDKQPSRPPVANIKSNTRMMQGKVQTSFIKLTPFPNNGTAKGNHTVGTRENVGASLEGPQTVAKSQVNKDVDSKATKAKVTKKSEKSAEERKAIRNRESDARIGWILTGEERNWAYDGKSGTTYGCSDGEFRVLDLERLELATERTRMQTENIGKKAFTANTSVAIDDTMSCKTGRPENVNSREAYDEIEAAWQDQNATVHDSALESSAPGQLLVIDAELNKGVADPRPEMLAVGDTNPSLGVLALGDADASHEMPDLGNASLAAGDEHEDPSAEEKSRKRRADLTSLVGVIGQKKARLEDGLKEQPGAGDQMLYSPYEASEFDASS